MRTYKGFIQRLDKVTSIVRETVGDKEKSELTKEELLVVVKCCEYIAHSYYKMAIINSFQQAGAGFLINDPRRKK
ncbi:hypothetical protein LaPh949_gp016 [Lactococcus phage 949]|uniref:Uncharacterized protein n=1 Tax=Lactococcus phage 949 TaxID=881953 RepID=E0YIQ3_9CAUD|nr:hypothetical protein LaPh949_gp016 [Lactococcus phage 949]ADM73574.1 hypothetical protein [Lactococcus phage 949]